jgi:hypothetical protein
MIAVEPLSVQKSWRAGVLVGVDDPLCDHSTTGYPTGRSTYELLANEHGSHFRAFDKIIKGISRRNDLDRACDSAGYIYHRRTMTSDGQKGEAYLIKHHIHAPANCFLV